MSLSATVARAIMKNRRPVRRCLFGKSTKEDTDRFLTSMTEALQKRDEERWGFSFIKEMPTTSASSPYSYEMVDASSVPAFYRATVYKTPRTPPSDADSDEENLDISMEGSDDSITSNPTPPKSSKKRQAKITNYFAGSRKRSACSSKSSTPSESPVMIPASIFQI